MDLIKVLRALEPVVEEWYMLGLHLDLTVNMVKAIEKDYPTIAQRKMSMVQKWMTAPQLCPSWCSLVKALCDIGLNPAAEMISKEYSKYCDIITLSGMSLCFLNRSGHVVPCFAGKCLEQRTSIANRKQ